MRPGVSDHGVHVQPQLSGTRPPGVPQRMVEQPSGARGLSGRDLQMGRRTLNHRLQYMAGLAADSRRVPQPLQHFVTLPPVALIEQVDAVEVFLALAPVFVVEVGQAHGGQAKGMALGVVGGVRRLAGNMAVGRKG